MPLQGALLIGITTQGAALGYELLPLQGVLVAWGLAFVLRVMDIDSGGADCMGLAFVPRAMDISSGRADYSIFYPYRRSKKAVVLTP